MMAWGGGGRGTTSLGSTWEEKVVKPTMSLKMMLAHSYCCAISFSPATCHPPAPTATVGPGGDAGCKRSPTSPHVRLRPPTKHERAQGGRGRGMARPMCVCACVCVCVRVITRLPCA